MSRRFLNISTTPPTNSSSGFPARAGPSPVVAAPLATGRGKGSKICQATAPVARSIFNLNAPAPAECPCPRRAADGSPRVYAALSAAAVSGCRRARLPTAAVSENRTAETGWASRPAAGCRGPAVHRLFARTRGRTWHPLAARQSHTAADR